jgi:hypothetical protein
LALTAYRLSLQDIVARQTHEPELLTGKVAADIARTALECFPSGRE